MKLYLSSYRIPNAASLLKLVGKEPSDIEVAIIPNAKDYYSDFVKSLKNKELLKDLELIGLTNCETLDLNKFSSSKSDELRNRLKEFDLIWVNGGNTFCLRYAMRKSGFDRIISDVLDGGVVYGGESAGAIVAGDTMHGAEFADQPEFTEEQIYDGLNLVESFIVPHTDSPKYAEVKAQIIDTQKNHPSVVQLKDSEALVVDGEDRAIVSS